MPPGGGEGTAMLQGAHCGGVLLAADNSGRPETILEAEILPEFNSLGNLKEGGKKPFIQRSEDRTLFFDDGRR